jgi:chromosome segregation ATPase
MAKKKKGKKGKKKKEVPEPDDEYMKMDGLTLEKKIQNLKERLGDVKMKRNLIQIEKDMIHDFYSNTKNEVKDIESQVKNYETKMEQMEEQHKVMIKVYMQKVKHLEYEHDQDRDKVKLNAETAMGAEKEYNVNSEKDMKKDKQEKKIQYGDNDNANLSEVETVEEELKAKLKETYEVLNASKKELINNYERKLAALKKELELRLKVEIHEIEERKNQHYNDLMKNHEKAFRDMKDYYNDITRENLELIRVHKENLHEVNNSIILNQTQIDFLKAQNGQLEQPLMLIKNQRNTLKKQLATYEKDQMSLRNAKAQFKVLKKKVHDFQVMKKELDEKMEKIKREKNDMYAKFEVAVDQLKGKAEYKNTLLDEKLSQLEEDHQRKETQLHELIQRSVVEPKTVDEICKRMEEAIEAKNSLLRNLRYSLAHATKAYNDAIRVYEAKLIEFGIPAEELGLELLDTNTSTMPAGLVAA